MIDSSGKYGRRHCKPSRRTSTLVVALILFDWPHIVPVPNSLISDTPKRTDPALDQHVILLTGASGYVGGRLLPLLNCQGRHIRCLVRSPDTTQSLPGQFIEVVKGDVLNRVSLESALRGVTMAYYLVHLMASSEDFQNKDREAAEFCGSGKTGGREKNHLPGWPWRRF